LQGFEKIVCGQTSKTKQPDGQNFSIDSLSRLPLILALVVGLVPPEVAVILVEILVQIIALCPTLARGWWESLTMYWAPIVVQWILHILIWLFALKSQLPHDCF
jgi:hypothetical protein